MFSTCSFLIFALVLPQLGQCRLGNATQDFGHVSDVSSEHAAETSESAFSDEEAEDAADKAYGTEHGDDSEEIQGNGMGEDTPENVAAEAQSTADAAESQADNTEPATEIMGAMEDDAEASEDSDADTQDTEAGSVEPSFAQHKAKGSRHAPSDRKVHQKALMMVKMFEKAIQRKRDDDDDDGASSDETEGEEDSDSSGQDQAEAVEETEGVEEHGQEEAAEPAAQGSDAEMYGGNEQPASYMDTYGADAGSDMAMYANGGDGSEVNAGLIQTTRQDPGDDEDLGLSSDDETQSQEEDSDSSGQEQAEQEEGQGQEEPPTHQEEGSDAALYGGNHNDNSANPINTAGADAGSDMALYANGGDGSAGNAALIQTTRRHMALFGDM